MVFIKGLQIMAAYKIKWSNLLYLAELEFIPERPAQLIITDEIIQSISWLTAASKHDRKLLRCDDNGVLLVGNAWDNLSSVESAELTVINGTPGTITCTVPNKGVLISTSTQPVKITYRRFGTVVDEDVYLPPGWLYWIAGHVCTVTATYISAPGSDTSIVGVTAFN